jgi:hypothetical protein
MNAALLKKLNHKEGTPIFLLNAPYHLAAEFGPAETTLPDEGASFVVGFAIRADELNQLADLFATRTEGDATLWVCYPKQSSKRYKCEFDRDHGWDQFGAHNFEPVRQVAIDEDWSALRVRRVEFIKNLTRGFALSDAAKVRIAEKPTR